jgi:hypothetical protein
MIPDLCSLRYVSSLPYIETECQVRSMACEESRACMFIPGKKTLQLSASFHLCPIVQTKAATITLIPRSHACTMDNVHRHRASLSIRRSLHDPLPDGRNAPIPDHEWSFCVSSKVHPALLGYPTSLLISTSLRTLVARPGAALQSNCFTPERRILFLPNIALTLHLDRRLANHGRETQRRKRQQELPGGLVRSSRWTIVARLRSRGSSTAGAIALRCR